jgi:enoyl-CoA hydratase
MTNNEVVSLDASDGILTITICRPEARNAVDLAVARALAAAMQKLDTSEDLHVGLLQGAGGTFSAGADLKAIARGERAILVPGGFAGFVETPPAKPLIAAVEGYALGGGFEMALCCDLVVASDTARFGLPEVKRGLLASAGGLLRLPRQLPPRLALELALTGEPIDARVALQHGLINRVVPVGQALEHARALAVSISANGPLAVRASKQIMRESQDWPASEAFQRQKAITEPVFASADAREGARAFAEKRPAVWQGR